MTARAGVAFVDIRSDWSSFDRSLATHGKTVTGQASKLGQSAGRAIARGLEVGVKTGAVAAAGAAIFAIKKAGDFQGELSNLGAVSDATAKQMERFRKQAIKAGADTKFSALEAAQAQTELAKGGLATSKILKGGLSSALALAAAGELDLAEAAETTVNQMKLFRISGKDSIKVADALATAANKTTADVRDYALALKQSGSAAHTAGLSFTETVTALETLAEAGIKGSDAGTSLKTALIQLASPSSLKAQNLAEELGVNVFDAAGNMKSLVDVSANLRKSLGDLTREQRIQAATTLVGQDGFRALLALYDAGPRKVARMQKELEKQGTAADVAKKKQDNLKGSFEQFTGSLETLGIQVGTLAIPALRKLTDEATDFTNEINGIVGNDKLTLGEKLNEIFEVAKVNAEPWIQEIEYQIDRANVPEKLADLISTGTPIIIAAAAKSGAVAAKTFAGAFANADVWGKLALGAFLVKKIGLGGKGGGLTGGGGGGAGGFLTSNKPIPVFVVNQGVGGGVGGPGGVPGGKGAGRVKGLLKSGGKLAGKLAVLDLAINLVDQRGNPITALVNSAHDLTFGIVPKVDVPSGKERVQAAVDKDTQAIDRLIKGGKLDQLAKKIKDLRADAADSRAFGAEDIARQQEKLADKAEAALGRMSDRLRETGRLGDAFARNIKGLRLKGSKDFDGLVRAVTYGSKQILKVGGEKSQKTKEEVSRQFDLARKRIRDHFRGPDGVVHLSKAGYEALHQLAVKELGLYGIKAGRVNVVLAKGANGEFRPHQRGGHINEGAPSGDSVPSLLERGEYVLNRNAVKKMGKRALDRLNFGMAPRFQTGGMVDPAWDPGGQRLAAAISGRVGSWARRFNADMTAGYDPGGGHVSPGHNVTGTATDMVPAGGNWDLLEKGLRLLVAQGLKVLYGSNGIGTPWPNHGRGNHAHIEWGSGGGALPALFDGLKRVALKGPGSVAMEVAQAGLDRVRSAANAAVDGAIGFSGEGGEAGSGFTAGGFSKAQLKRLWIRAGGNPSVANLMAAIALAESGGNPGARNPSGASGLWQILGLPFPGDVFDPLTNARMAVSKYNSQGLGAWEAYTNGSYSQYLQRGGLIGKLGKTLKRVTSPKLRKGAVAGLLAKIKKAGLPRPLQDRLKELAGDSDRFAEFADRASQITTTDANGNEIPGVVGGKTQEQWLEQELTTLFKWRNKLIQAIQVAREKRGTVENTLGRALMARGSLKTRIDLFAKHPKKYRDQLRKLRPQLRALEGKIIPALRGQRGALGGVLGDLRSNLEDVQGIGSPMGQLAKLPGLGVLGGRIFDTQIAIRDLGAQEPPVTDTTERDSLLTELGRQVVQRSLVENVQNAVLRDFPGFPPFGGSFADGGVVPGPVGAPRTIVAHGGEYVDPNGLAGRAGTVLVVVEDGAVREDRIRVISGQEAERRMRTASRNAGRGLPGRGGGNLR